MSHVKLTLVSPSRLGEQVVEALLDNGALAGGFTTFPASGHGRDFGDATLREKVRGCVDTITVIMVLPMTAVAPLLAALREKFPTPHLVYWTEPVLSFGDLG